MVAITVIRKSMGTRFSGMVRPFDPIFRQKSLCINSSLDSFIWDSYVFEHGSLYEPIQAADKL